MNKTKNLFLLSFLAVLMFSIIGVSAQQESIGPFKVNTNVSLLQSCANCTYCNISSVEFPNGTQASGEVAMQKIGTKYNYTYDLGSTTGRYIVNGFCDVDGSDTVWAYSFASTLTGNSTPDGMPIFQAILSIIIFGVACFMLFVSIKLEDLPPKIFFLIASFIFIMGAMLTMYQYSVEYNVSETLGNTTVGIVFAIGMILFVVFAYLMIRQTVNILDMYKVKKGLAWGGSGQGYRMAGYNPGTLYGRY